MFSRRVVGWQLSTSLRTDLALDALNMGLWTRRHEGHDTSALVHHPLTDDERAAVDDGHTVVDALLARLTDIPTPAGPTPLLVLAAAEAPVSAAKTAPAVTPVAMTRVRAWVSLRRVGRMTWRASW